jgi:hypothetical protein
MMDLRALGRTALAGALLGAALAAPGGESSANGRDLRPDGEEPPTRFERFVQGGCVPCVTESHAVVKLPLGALKLPAFPRPAAGGMMPPGEIRLDVLRASELGRPSRQSLAIRMILSMTTGGGLYRLAAGLLDEDDVPALSSAVGEIARVAAAPPAGAGAESVDIAYHGGSLRVGLIRYAGETVAYVQAGDPHPLALQPVWEVGSTLFMAPGTLAELMNAIRQLTAKIRELREP